MHCNIVSPHDIDIEVGRQKLCFAIRNLAGPCQCYVSHTKVLNDCMWRNLEPWISMQTAKVSTKI